VWNITVESGGLPDTVDLFVYDPDWSSIGGSFGLNTYTFRGNETGVGWDVFWDVTVAVACIPASVEGQLDNLRADVEGFGLSPRGVENSLFAKLDNARTAYLEGDESTACSLIEAFVNQVNALEGVRLTNEAAGALRAAAEDISSEIGCLIWARWTHTPC
jgi:hypothetical protein